jgi:hypothetical protein
MLPRRAANTITRGIKPEFRNEAKDNGYHGDSGVSLYLAQGRGELSGSKGRQDNKR